MKFDWSITSGLASLSESFSMPDSFIMRLSYSPTVSFLGERDYCFRDDDRDYYFRDGDSDYCFWEWIVATCFASFFSSTIACVYKLFLSSAATDSY